MAINVIYKVDTRNEEYASEQEAMVAETLIDMEMYIESYKLKTIAKAITDKFFLIPHKGMDRAKAVEVANNAPVSQAMLDQRELDSYGPSA